MGSNPTPSASRLHGAACGARPAEDAAHRWDGSSVHDFDGTYGDYLLSKIGKVFTQLREPALS